MVHRDDMVQPSRVLFWARVPGSRMGTKLEVPAAAPSERAGEVELASAQLGVACPCMALSLHPCEVLVCLGTCAAIEKRRSQGSNQYGVGMS